MRRDGVMPRLKLHQNFFTVQPRHYLSNREFDFAEIMLRPFGTSVTDGDALSRWKQEGICRADSELTASKARGIAIGHIKASAILIRIIYHSLTRTALANMNSLADVYASSPVRFDLRFLINLRGC